VIGVGRGLARQLPRRRLADHEPRCPRRRHVGPLWRLRHLAGAEREAVPPRHRSLPAPVSTGCSSARGTTRTGVGSPNCGPVRAASPTTVDISRWRSTSPAGA